MRESTPPLGDFFVPVAQSGQSGGLLIRAAGVRIPPGSPIRSRGCIRLDSITIEASRSETVVRVPNLIKVSNRDRIYANIAPMVERLFCNQDVEGSSPSVSTIRSLDYFMFGRCILDI